MKTDTLLHIQEPCSEKWNSMSGGSAERFCASCSKTVIDFTSLSDKEILNVLSKTVGKACGRFNAEQLHRPILVPTNANVYAPTKIFISAFISTFLIANAGVAQEMKQGKKKHKQATHINAELENEKALLGEVVVTKKPGISELKAVATPSTSETFSNTVSPPLNIMMGKIQVYSKVSLVDNFRTFARKAFKQQAFKLFANPVTVGGILNIQFKEAGDYTIQLLDASGRLFVSKELAAKVSQDVIPFTLPANALAGNYFIKVIAGSNKTYVDHLFIQ